MDLALATLDALLLGAAYYAILTMRFDGAVPPEFRRRFPTFCAIAIATHLLWNWTWGLYGQVWRHASIAEARRVVLAGASSSFSLFVMIRGSGIELTLVPRSVLLLGGLTGTALLGAVRFQSRLFAFTRASERGESTRVVVAGAGEAGTTIVRELLRSTSAGIRPVAFVDDDPRLVGRVVCGLPVEGSLHDIGRVLSAHRAQQVILAIPSADQDLVARVAATTGQAGVPLRVLPPMREIVAGRPSVRDVRDLRIEDLLGRSPVDSDLDAVRLLLQGRRVLITGGGGSIGSEIARQVAMFDPGCLVLLDHDETHLFDAAGAAGDRVELCLADLRDVSELRRVFTNWRPEVVFHAAAHKHVPLLEAHPSEAVRTNVLGTAALTALAAEFGVERFVFVSTDKAVRPANVMGATKWLGEQLVFLRAPADARWCAVRFGNVLGSRGSVIPTFTRQIAAGGPVTVTHPAMTRFFMSVGEAVQLVLQAAALSSGREIFMLEMGSPVSILELAKRMITLSGRRVGSDIEIRFIGARPGEKLAEELQAPEETSRPTSHPAISALTPASVPPASVERIIEELRALAEERRERALAHLLLAFPNRAADPFRRDELIDLVLEERSHAWSQSST